MNLLADMMQNPLRKFYVPGVTHQEALRTHTSMNKYELFYPARLFLAEAHGDFAKIPVRQKKDILRQTFMALENVLGDVVNAKSEQDLVSAGESQVYALNRRLIERLQQDVTD